MSRWSKPDFKAGRDDRARHAGRLSWEVLINRVDQSRQRGCDFGAIIHRDCDSTAWNE